MQVNLTEAGNSLSSLIVAVEQGEEVLITREGLLVAKIVKYDAPRVKPPGAWKGKVVYPRDWNFVETNAAIENLFSKVDDAPPA